jgi:hypothetical protein
MHRSENKNNLPESELDVALSILDFPLKILFHCP